MTEGRMTEKNSVWRDEERIGGGERERTGVCV